MAKAVIFDADGTLIDTVDLHAASWVEALRHFGRETTHEEVRRQIGKGGDQLMPVFLPQEVVERRGEEVEAFRKRLFMRDCIGKARAFPGVPDLFRRVRAAGQRVVLASSAKGDELERYKEIAGIAELVDAATSSDDAERSKPFPDIFLAALDRIAPIGAPDAVVVGDTPYDAEPAGKAGLRTLGVLCGGFPEADLRAAGCVAVYHGPVDLLANYERSPLAPGWAGRHPPPACTEAGGRAAGPRRAGDAGEQDAAEDAEHVDPQAPASDTARVQNGRGAPGRRRGWPLTASLRVAARAVLRARGVGATVVGVEEGQGRRA